MATELAKAYVQIVPSASGIKGSITNALGGEANSAGKSAGQSFGGSMVSTLKGVIAAAGIGAAFSAAINEGAALQQSLGGIETLFKDNADVVKQYATEAYKTAGLSANDYMETVTGFSASLLQGLNGDTAKAAEISNMAITDMADNANKMGTPMESIQNAYQGFAKQNYTMLDNLKLGYGGTKTEMQRLLADAQKISGVKYDLDNLSDVYSAIHVIQEEMDITGTTAKEAASTISGSAASMKSAFKNVLGNLALGEDVGPALQALSETVMTFLDNLLPAVGNILKGLPQALETALTLAVRSMNGIGYNAKNLVEQGVQFVGNFLSGIITNVPYLIDGVVNMAASIGKALLEYDWQSAVQGFISQIKSNLDIAAGEILGTDGNIVQSVINSIMANLPKMLKTAEYIISSLVSGIFSALPKLAESAFMVITELVNGLIVNLPQMLESGKGILMSLLNGIWEALPQLLLAAGNMILSIRGTLISNFPQIISAGFDLLTSLIKGFGEAAPKMMSTVGELLSNIWNATKEIDWLQLGKDIIMGLINGMGAMQDALWDAAVNVARSALDAIKGFFGIASPSRLMRDEVGRFIPAGIAVGITQNTKPITKAMQSVADLTTGCMQTSLSTDLTQSGVAGVNSSGSMPFGNFTQIIQAPKQTPVEIAATSLAYLRGGRWSMA